MAKTNPIGVRFRTDVLEKLNTDHKIDTPQKALVFLEQFYINHYKLATDPKEILRSQQRQNALQAQPRPVKPDLSRDAILKQIEAIQAEQIPKERDTPLGRPSWRLDQQKRINELKKQLQWGQRLKKWRSRTDGGLLPFKTNKVEFGSEAKLRDGLSIQTTTIDHMAAIPIPVGTLPTRILLDVNKFGLNKT